MGKLARGALAVAAPEAAVGRRITPGMSPGQVNDELQRRRAARAARAAAPGHPMVPAAAPAPASPPPASPGGGPSLPSLPSLPMPAAAATGSGFLLGVFAWAVALAYLRGGPAEVRKFMSAKFLNKV